MYGSAAGTRELTSISGSVEKRLVASLRPQLVIIRFTELSDEMRVMRTEGMTCREKKYSGVRRFPKLRFNYNLSRVQLDWEPQLRPVLKLSMPELPASFCAMVVD